MRSIRPSGALVRVAILGLLIARCALAAPGLRPRTDLWNDPWGTTDHLPALGAYSPGRHGLPRWRVPPPPSRSQLATLRSLPRLTAWALRHNPRTAMAWEALRAQAAALGVAKSVWLPSVDGTLTEQRAKTVVRGTNIASGPTDALYSTLSFSEVLFHFGYRRAHVARARAALLVARYGTDESLQRVALVIADAYYGLAQARADVAVYRRDVRESGRIYQAARHLYRAHLKPITDVELAKTQWAEARSQLLSIEGLERVRRAQLAETAGLPVGTPLTAASLRNPGRPVPVPVRRWLHRALRDNPALLADLARVREAHRLVRETAARGWPSVSLMAGAGNAEFPHGPDENSFALGIQVNVPFDMNFAQTYRIQQEQALTHALRAQTHARAHRILLAVWRAYYGLQSSLRAYRKAALAARSAHAALIGIRTQYRIGLADMLDVITAESDLTAARLTRLHLLSDSYRYRAALFRYAALIPRGALRAP